MYSNRDQDQVLVYLLMLSSTCNSPILAKIKSESMLYVVLRSNIHNLMIQFTARLAGNVVISDPSDEKDGSAQHAAGRDSPTQHHGDCVETSCSDCGVDGSALDKSFCMRESLLFSLRILQVGRLVDFVPREERDMVVIANNDDKVQKACKEKNTDAPDLGNACSGRRHLTALHANKNKE